MKNVYFLIALLACTPLSTACSDFEWQEDLFDFSDVATLQEEQMAANIKIKRVTPSRNDVVAILTDPNGLLGDIQLQNILENQPLYLRSNPITRRNIIDAPMFQYFTDYTPFAGIEMMPFVTQTYSEYYYDTQQHMPSYVDMQQSVLIRNLTANNLIPVGANPQALLAMFQELLLQERRLGIMFQFVKTSEYWSFYARVPFYWIEHNLFLEDDNAYRIRNTNASFFAIEEPQVENTPKKPAAEETAFAQQHLISDCLGFGDTRLNLEFLVKDHRAQRFAAGPRITIPTAFSVKKGLYGSYFPPLQPDPNFDLYNDLLAPILSTPENLGLASLNMANFGAAALDRLSAILLQQPTGNNGHWGLGMFAHNCLMFADRYSLSSLYSFEILLPADEYRFYILQPDAAAYNAFDWADTDPVTGRLNEKYAFLNQQFIQKAFPTCYRTAVFPGLILQGTSALTYNGFRNIDYTAGSDIWWQTKEHIMYIYGPDSTKQFIDVSTAKKDYALQMKIWFSIEKKPYTDSSWKLGLRAESTTTSFGVGGDWGLSIYIRKEF